MGRLLVANRPWPPVYPPNGHAYVGATLTTTAAYHERDGARLRKYGGLYWLAGGWWPNPGSVWYPATTTNEVWSSPDCITWTLRLEHDPDPPTSGPGARWRRRHTFPEVEYQGAWWILGGDLNDGYRSDVWRSTDPGNANGWERIAESAPWGPNVYDPAVGVFDGWIHLVGGWDQNDGARACNRHWRFNGSTWERLPDMPFSRASSSRLVTIGDRLHLVAGGSGQYGPAKRHHNDTWAYNGKRWKQMSATAPFPESIWPAVDAYDGKLWMGPRGGYNGNEGGTYYSEDCGRTWTASPVSPWPASHADALFASETDGLTIASGNGMGQSVFRLQRTP